MLMRWVAGLPCPALPGRGEMAAWLDDASWRLMMGMMHIDDEGTPKGKLPSENQGPPCEERSRESAREIRGRPDGGEGGSHERGAREAAAESPKREAEHASGSSIAISSSPAPLVTQVVVLAPSRPPLSTAPGSPLPIQHPLLPFRSATRQLTPTTHMHPPRYLLPSLSRFSFENLPFLYLLAAAVSEAQQAQRR